MTSCVLYWSSIVWNPTELMLSWFASVRIINTSSELLFNLDGSLIPSASSSRSWFAPTVARFSYSDCSHSEVANISLSFCAHEELQNSVKRSDTDQFFYLSCWFIFIWFVLRKQQRKFRIHEPRRDTLSAVIFTFNNRNNFSCGVWPVEEYNRYHTECSAFGSDCFQFSDGRYFVLRSTRMIFQMIAL